MQTGVDKPPTVPVMPARPDESAGSSCQCHLPHESHYRVKCERLYSTFYPEFTRQDGVGVVLAVREAGARVQKRANLTPVPGLYPTHEPQRAEHPVRARREDGSRATAKTAWQKSSKERIQAPLRFLVSPLGLPRWSLRAPLLPFIQRDFPSLQRLKAAKANAAKILK